MSSGYTSYVTSKHIRYAMIRGTYMRAYMHMRLIRVVRNGGGRRADGCFGQAGSRLKCRTSNRLVARAGPAGARRPGFHCRRRAMTRRLKSGGPVWAATAAQSVIVEAGETRFLRHSMLRVTPASGNHTLAHARTRTHANAHTHARTQPHARAPQHTPGVIRARRCAHPVRPGLCAAETF